MEATTVKLKCDDLGEKEFEFSHAQRILDIQTQKKRKNGWELSDNKFELKDGIIKLRNTKPPKKAEEQGVVGEGGVPSEQA